MATPSEDLQRAIHEALLADPAVTAVVGGRVYDGRPKESNYPCITFGPSETVPDDMDCITAGTEVLQIDCWVRDSARVRPAKALAEKVKAALHRRRFDLETHALGRLAVTQIRGIMDPDGETGHGVVVVSATIEDRS